MSDVYDFFKQYEEKKRRKPVLPEKKQEPLQRPLSTGISPVDDILDYFGLETSPMYQRSKGAIPKPPAPDDPNVSLARLIASSDDPVAEIARLNATQYIARTLKQDLGHTYANLDTMSEYWLGKVVPPETLAKSLKNAWDNGTVNYELSKLALKLREQGGTDPALIKRIQELEQSMTPLEDIPRPWWKKALLIAAESSPLMAQSLLHGGILGAATGTVAGGALAVSPPGLVAAGVSAGLSVPAIVAAMGSVGFVVGSTKDLMESMRGTAYWRMRANEVPHNIAAPLSDIEGIAEGAIESVGQVALGFVPGLKGLGSIIAEKLMVTGAVGIVATRIAANMVGAALGEGIEEPLQEAAAMITDIAANELAKNQGVMSAIAPLTVEEVAQRIGDAAYGGLLGGLVFGVVGIPGGIKADIQTLNQIKNTAIQMPTRQGFINYVAENAEFEVPGVSEAKWKEYLGKVWDQQHPTKPTVQTQEAVTTKKGETVPVQAAVKKTEGRVYTEVEERTKTREGTTAILKAGDPETGERYGYVAYEISGNQLYINDVVNETEEDMRRELVLDLAARNPGVEIEWNPTDELDVALKEDLIATNPRGVEAGIQHFEAVAAPEAQKTLTRTFFVERMGELFNTKTPEQAETYGKLVDALAGVSNKTADEWLQQYIAPEVTTEAVGAGLNVAQAVAGTQFRVEGEAISPLKVDLPEFKNRVKAVFTALEKADFHHGVHEFFHAVERLALSPEQIRKFENALGKLRQTWTVADIETLADHFEDYLTTNEAPTPELKTVFEQIAEAFQKLISFIMERLDQEPGLLSDEFIEAYDALFKKPESGLAQAEVQETQVTPKGPQGQVIDPELVPELFHRDTALQDIFNDASINMFGTTTNPEHGAWILSDGKMPDFSWEKNKKTKGLAKYFDRIAHSEIERVFQRIDPQENLFKGDTYAKAWQAGAVRMDISAKQLSIQSTKIPTPEQLRTIDSAMDGVDGVNLEIMSKDAKDTLSWEAIDQPEMKDVRRFYIKAGRAMETGEVLYHDEIKEILDKNEYKIYGIRAMTSPSDLYSKEYAEKHGLVYSEGREIVPGALSEKSYKWKDEQPTGRLLSGTSAIRITSENIDEALDIYFRQGAGYYTENQIVLVGGESARAGVDPGEVIIKSAKVLKILRPSKSQMTLFHLEDWQGEFLYGTPVDANIYQQYVEEAGEYESPEAFRKAIELQYGEPGDTDIQGAAAIRFYQEVWEASQIPEQEPEARIPIQSPVIPSAPTYDYQEKMEAAKDVDDAELAAKIESGEITEADIEKLSEEAEAEGAITREAARTETDTEAMAAMTAEEQLAVRTGDELEAAMEERERLAARKAELAAIEKKIKSLRTRLMNALAGNEHIAVLMEEQGTWKRILSKEAEVEEAEAYAEGIAFGREVQKVIDTEKASGKLRETKAKMYAEKRAAVAKVKGEARKAKAKQRAARKLREARKKLIRDIMRPPGKNVQFRGYAEQIRIIQDSLEPKIREYRIKGGVQIQEKTKKGYAREQTRKFFEDNPEAAAMVPKEKLERFYAIPLKDMSMAQLEEIAETIDVLRKQGVLKRHLELVQRKRRMDDLRNRSENTVLRGKPPEKPIGGVKPTGKVLKVWLATLKPARVLALLDGVFEGGKEGVFTELGWTRVNEAWTAFKKAERTRKEPVIAKMKELGFTLDPLGKLKGQEWVKRPFNIDGFKYTNGKMPTLEEVMYWYIGMKNERTAAALLYGNNLVEGLSGEVITKGIAMLTDKQRAMADAIDEDGSKNFSRLREAFIDYFNIDLPGEEHYVRMVRKEISYETREEQIAAELTGRAGIRKQFVARHSTYARIDIADEHQKPIRTDLFTLWNEGVIEQEGFISQYAMIKEMHDVFESDQVRAAVTQKYGPDLNRWLKKYTNDLAQAEAYTNLQQLEKFSRMSRAHATIAWLGFNALSVAKQTVGVFGYWADLGPLAPAYMLSAAAKLSAGQVKAAAGGHFIQNTHIDWVKSKSEYVRNRQISVDLENLKSMKPTLYNAIVGKIGRWGMKGLEVMDIATVCMGWTAVYDKTMRDTQGDEAAAIKAADAAAMRSQPSARVQDMAEIYRQGEVMKWFTMFTSELSVIWNRLTFDVPLALRRKEFMRAILDLTALAMAGVCISIASGALIGDDEEKKKKLALGASAEFIESIPIFGNDIFAYISGRQFQSSGVKLVPAVTMYMETAKDITDQDWDGVIKNGLEALAFTAGLPYSQPRRIIKTIADEDLRHLLGWPED